MTSWLRTGLVLTLLLAACGHKAGNTAPDATGTGGGPDAAGDPTGDGGGTIDAPPGGDAMVSTMCDPSGPQCNNCKDDDGDGRIDGFDPECTGQSDNDEASFATGIPGDNKDPVMQDCFFDGNSGAGNDGCNVHVCCLLGARTVAECPIGANRYDPAACPPPIGQQPLSQQCIDTCGKLTPAGCDCFGCCTICDPATNECHDIDINLMDSVGCTPDTLGDPTKCLSCTKSTTCGSAACGGETCILCPGQDPADLPASCRGATMCPPGGTSCTSDAGCGALAYCANGCCIGVIQ